MKRTLVSLAVLSVVLCIFMMPSGDTDADTGSGYFYDQLEDGSKLIYDALAGMDPDGLEAEVKLPSSGLSENDIHEQWFVPAFEAVHLENPIAPCCWSGARTNTQITMAGSIATITMKVSFNNEYSSGIAAKYHETLEAAENVTIVGETDVDRIIAIDRYLRDRLIYDSPASAAGASSHDAYGALVDPKNVSVCEGYAKAFLLLCILNDVDCIMPTGQGYSGSGWEPHAWNYVRIQGAWYPVDTTWNDSTNTDNFMLSSAADFLEGHKIQQTEGVDFTYPTLSEDKYGQCLHKYVASPDNSVPATCTEGSKDAYVCTKCGHIMHSSLTAAYGHSWSVDSSEAPSFDGYSVTMICARCGIAKDVQRTLTEVIIDCDHGEVIIPSSVIVDGKCGIPKNEDSTVFIVAADDYVVKNVKVGAVSYDDSTKIPVKPTGSSIVITAEFTKRVGCSSIYVPGLDSVILLRNGAVEISIDAYDRFDNVTELTGAMAQANSAGATNASIGIRSNSSKMTLTSDVLNVLGDRGLNMKLNNCVIDLSPQAVGILKSRGSEISFIVNSDGKKDSLSVDLDVRADSVTQYNFGMVGVIVPMGAFDVPHSSVLNIDTHETNKIASISDGKFAMLFTSSGSASVTAEVDKQSFVMDNLTTIVYAIVGFFAIIAILISLRSNRF